MQHAPRKPDGVKLGPVALQNSLTVLAILLVVTGLVTALFLIVPAAAERELDARLIFGAVWIVLFGGFGACLCWVATWMIATYYELLFVQRRLLSLLSEPAADVSATPPVRVERPADNRDLLQGILAELQERNANSLLSAEQREAKRRREHAARADELAAEIEQAITSERFSDAREALARLEAEIPDDPRREQWQRQLSAARAHSENEDVRRETSRVEDLMALADFAQAAQAALALRDKHPQSANAAQLIERVHRERNAFELEQRRQLYAEVERRVEAHQWRAAVETGRKLLAAYPDSPESRTVTRQMATLEDNARIEEVRDMRDTIRELLERRRYAEAAVMGKEVIAKFPDTRAAEELRSQLPRLEKLARADDDRRA